MDMDEKAMIAIVKASEAYKKKASAIFKSYGLSWEQYNILRVLDHSEEITNSITQISKKMLVTCGNMTGMAKRLEKGGYLIRKSDPNDDRKTLLEITPKGKRTLNHIDKEKDLIVAKCLEGTTPEETLHLLDILKRILRQSALLKA
jgi:DNA-binding MarR family transcriptional regulator